MIDFQKDVLDRSHETPVVVQMSAQWCSPCRMIKPQLKEACHKNNLPFVVVDVDLQPEIAREYNVRSVPHIMSFRNGLVDLKHDRTQPVSVFVNMVVNTPF